MPTSLVTDGAGFIGSDVAEHLIQDGHQVAVLDDLSGGFLDNVPAEATFIRGSVVDAELVDGLFARMTTFIISLPTRRKA
ncbi:MAG TPA: NAD-dependent epimerase/dehydratase family protein [Terriglobales bacterium]|nr:NAD-dependent epimerase/dehydratase family protein [Terriglobales bacterium]